MEAALLVDLDLTIIEQPRLQGSGSPSCHRLEGALP
jgi:hypothetical protein